MDGQLPRAKRLMIPSGGGAGRQSRSVSPPNVAQVGESDAQRRTEDITTVDGIMGLHKRVTAANATAAAGTASINPYFTAGMADMSGGMMGYDQDPVVGGTGDPMQDMMFDLENMDWNMLMSTDPTEFMGGGWY